MDVQEMMLQNFHIDLFSTILATCPVDSYNMISHITLDDYGDYYKITISGPRKQKTGGIYDYARDVNYNRQRTPKEARNFLWVERAIRQACELVGGDIGHYEL